MCDESTKNAGIAARIAQWDQNDPTLDKVLRHHFTRTGINPLLDATVFDTGLCFGLKLA